MLLLVKNFLNNLFVAPLHVDSKERLRAFLGVSFGLLVTAIISRWVLTVSADNLGGLGSLMGLANAPATWLVAPIGASAIIVFVLPASPMAQPWAVLGGNTMSALIGVVCANSIADPAIAASVAVGSAVALMFLLRCLHPPGGAVALLVVILHVTSYKFALFPVFFNAIVLVLAGGLYNNLTGRRYPHRQSMVAATFTSRFSDADLDIALVRYNQIMDVNPDDLKALLHHAELASYQRNLGDLRCADIMSPNPLAVQFGTPLDEAWQLMRQRHVKALPVVDRSHRVVGIITVADFMKQIDLESHTGIGVRFKIFLQRSGTSHSDKPDVVGQIMTRRIQVTNLTKHAIELVPLFTKGGHRHIPVIDHENRLVGIIAPSDLMRALYSAVSPETQTQSANH
jgi:CBS domain-containing membrane protein